MRQKHGGFASWFMMERVRADAATAFRGHAVSWGEPTMLGDGRWEQTGVCLHCFREVQLLPEPDANEIQLGGEALALTCGKGA
jgi:hypothetical protein